MIASEPIPADIDLNAPVTAGDLAGWAEYHKDTYNYRPSWDDRPRTVGEYLETMELIERDVLRDIARSKASSIRATAQLELEILTIMSEQKVSRPTAIRWLCQAEGLLGPQDVESFMYFRGIQESPAKILEAEFTKAMVT